MHFFRPVKCLKCGQICIFSHFIKWRSDWVELLWGRQYPPAAWLHAISLLHPSFINMSSPSSSPSLSSSASLQPAPQYPLPLTQSFLYETYRPGALHLTPCTVDQYFELPFGNDDKYELVNGLLWWKGMVTHTHDEARDRNAAEINRRFLDRSYVVVVERSLHVASSSQHASNRSNSTSTSLASDSDCCTIRRPDIAVFEPVRTPNRGDLSPRSQKITFPRNHPPLLVMELTSPSSRNVDLHSKWNEYEKAGVPCYVIVDRAAKKDPSVIVGILANGTYSKSVFRGDDVVTGSLFDELRFSAQYLLDPPRSLEEIRQSPVKKLKTTIARQARENARKANTIDRQAQRIAELERQMDSQTKREARTSSGSSANSNSPSKPPKQKRLKMKKNWSLAHEAGRRWG